MSPVRLIHLADYGGPYPGSFIPMIRASLNHARQHRGWAVEAWFSDLASDRDWLSDLAANELPVRIAPGGRSRRDLAAWIANSIVREQPTILHTHFTAFDVPALLAARRLPNSAVLWHLHTFPQPSLRARLGNLVKLGILLRGTAGLVCSSPWLEERAHHRGAAPSRTVTLPNAIDTDRFTPGSDAQHAAIRASLGVPEDLPLLMHLSWSWRMKGGDLFLATVRELVARGVEFAAITVGHDASRWHVSRSGLGHVVRVLTPREDVLSLYRAADVFLSTSRGEGLPFAILECMAAGTPVIASDIPAHRSFGADVSAYQLSAATPEAFADAITAQLAVDLDELAHRSATARKWAIRNASLDVWVTKLMGIYDRALSGSAPSTAPP